MYTRTKSYCISSINMSDTHETHRTSGLQKVSDMIAAKIMLKLKSKSKEIL